MKAGLYVFRAQSNTPGGPELDVPFIVAEERGHVGCDIQTISASGEAVQSGEASLSCNDAIRAAVDRAGGVCVFQAGDWQASLKRVLLAGERWFFHTFSTGTGTAGEWEVVAVHGPAAAALSRFLERNLGHAGLAEAVWGDAGRRQPSQARPQQPGAQSAAGFYLLPAFGRGNRRAYVPLVCWQEEGGTLLLNGIAASGALLPGEGRSKMAVLRMAAEAWGCSWSAAPPAYSWQASTKRAYLVEGEWIIPRQGARASNVQPAAARALDQFVTQHSWAAGLAQPPAERRRQSQAAAAGAGQSAGLAEQPAASPEGPAASRGGDGGASGAVARLTESSGCGQQDSQAAEAPETAPAAVQPAQQPLEAAPACEAAKAAWERGGACGGSSPAREAAEPGRDELEAGEPPLQPLQAQVEALFEPWCFEAEAQRLREGNRALAAENAALRQSVAALVAARARRAHLKARAKELKRQLKRLARQEQRVCRALRR